MSPIQQIFLGIGPSGDKYWWQKCDQTDSALSAYTGWSGYGSTILVDDDENSYFFSHSQTSRTCVFGFDKDGANIVKSYGADFVNSGSTLPTNKKFQITAKSGFFFDNKLYMAGQGVNTISGDASSTVISILNVPSGQTASGHARHSLMGSGQSKNHSPGFLTGRVGSGFTYSVDFDADADRINIGDASNKSSDLNFGSGDFTWECWIKADASQDSYPRIIHNNPTNTDWGSNASMIIWDHDSQPDRISFFVYNQNSSGSTPTLKSAVKNWNGDGQWHHVAVTRSSNVFRVFSDGVLEDTLTWSGSLDNADAYMGIGQRPDSTSTSESFKGSISNVRIVKGTAVYTANFAPSIVPLTNITNTVLLCCNGSSATSSTVTPATITANNSPTVAQDCPLSSTYLCGGDMINAALSPNTTRCPYFFKSSVNLNLADYGTADVFYAKREDPNSTYFTSGAYEDAAITSDGLYAYIAGTCGSNTTQGGGGNTSGGSWGGTTDAYLLKINYLTGAIITRACFPCVGPSAGTSMFYGIAIDSSGNIYCAGKAKQGYSGNKAYIIKLNSSMVVQWQKVISDITYIQQIVVDSSSNVYGVTTGGGQYGYIMKITSSGTMDWSTKITINGLTDRSPFLKGLGIGGEDENLYTAFTYNMNPSANSPTTTYRTQFACIKYPNTGNITGTKGDLVFTAGSLSTSDATMGTRTGNYVVTDERRQDIIKYDNTLYGNGNPTITQTNL